MQVSDEHLYLDTEIFVANDDGTISTSSEKLLHKNVGLADMPDVTSDAVSVDVTDYAGKLLYVQLTDWGYNYAAYLVQLPDTFEGTTLSLSDTTAFLFTGEQQQLVAFDTDTDTALTWTSSNADVASVDDSGLVTAKAPGVTTVTATTANGASVSCVVGVSDQLTYTGLRLDFDEMTTTMYFDSTIDLPGVYLEPYGFALSGKHNTYGTDGLTWSVSDPTIADLDEYSKTTLVANKDGKCTVCGAADPDYRPEQPEDPGQPEKPEQPENPGVKTGDSGVLLYMGLMLLALTGSAWVLRKKRAR